MDGLVISTIVQRLNARLAHAPFFIAIKDKT